MRVLTWIVERLINLMIDTADFACDYPFGTREERNRRG
jgi:hypothetical protein